MFPYPILPSRTHARRRDRRGRGLRGPLMPGAMPAARSRSGSFDDLVSMIVAILESQHGDLIDGVEFGVEDVPPSQPAPWERGSIPLGRYFPADLGMPHRIVVYRRPIMTRCASRNEQFALISHVLIEQIVHLTGRSPEDF